MTSLKKEITFNPFQEDYLAYGFHTIREWNKYPKIFHGFGTKRSAGSKRTKKDWFGKSLKLKGKEYPVVALRQVHGDEVIIFNGEKPQDLWYMEGDALLTRIPGYALTVFTADCLPILIHDPGQEVVGIIHAGWRGTAKGIVSKAVKKMQEIFLSKAEDMQIAMGPGICAQCLEVDQPVKEAFIKGEIPWEGVTLRKENGKWLLDLYKANMLAIMACGIKEENIIIFKACPSCRKEDYHSYRVEGKNSGRMINFIGLEKSGF